MVGLVFIQGLFMAYLGLVYGLLKNLCRVGLGGLGGWSMVCLASFGLDRLELI